jgi:hypothetical protein
MTLILKSLSEILEIVDLAIKNSPNCLVFIGNGLVPTLHVNNAKPTAPQGDGWPTSGPLSFPRKLDYALLVGASMPDGSTHPLHQRPINRSPTSVNDTDDTTH